MFIRIITFHGEGDGHLLEAILIKQMTSYPVSLKSVIKGHHLYYVFCDQITTPSYRKNFYSLKMTVNFLCFQLILTMKEKKNLLVR